MSHLKEETDLLAQIVQDLRASLPACVTVDQDRGVAEVIAEIGTIQSTVCDISVERIGGALTVRAWGDADHIFVQPDDVAKQVAIELDALLRPTRDHIDAALDWCGRTIGDTE